jgi:hypothetical protein
LNAFIGVCTLEETDIYIYRLIIANGFCRGVVWREFECKDNGKNGFWTEKIVFN